jgi:hypothetical protein
MTGISDGIARASTWASRMGLVLLLCWSTCNAQDSSKVDWGKTAIVAANLPLGIVLIEVMSEHRVKEVPRTSPHWRTEPCDAQNFDVAGNALYAYFLTRTIRHGYEYAGFSPLAATALSGANTLLLHAYLKYTESIYWGAEKHDFYGAWAGISFAIMQSAIPELERVQYKWLWNDNSDTTFGGPFLENYRAQRFFLSVRLGDYVFDNKFLQGFGLAFGGGLQGNGTVRNYFGLDYDIRVLVPGFLGEILNYIHIPLPAVYYDGKWHFGLSL